MLKYLCSLRCSLSPLFFFLIFTNSLGDSRLNKALPHLSIPNFVIRFYTGVLLHALIFMKAGALLLPIVRQASSTSHRISPCPSFLLLLEFAAATSDLRGCGSSQLVKLRRWALWWSYVQSASVFSPRSASMDRASATLSRIFSFTGEHKTEHLPEFASMDRALL